MNDYSQIQEKVEKIAAEHLAANGIELIEVIYRREGGGMVLRILADTAAGITIDECSGLNRFLSDVLDQADIISEPYTLEVSSPGLDRPLKTDKDFTRVLGKSIEVHTYQPFDGKRQHAGKLIGIDRTTIVLEAAGVSVVIDRDKISVARLAIDEDEG